MNLIKNTSLKNNPTQDFAQISLSKSPTYVFESDIQKMQNIIAAIVSVIKMPAYQASVLQKSPLIAQHDYGPIGVFNSYDFHITPDGPKLIEINTNAGGALLNAALHSSFRTTHPCENNISFDFYQNDYIQNDIINMFLSEWRLQQNNKSLATIAIVDDKPEQQYLYPEFLLFQNLFEKYGIHAVIADAENLYIKDNKLWHEETVIDLIYNRVTDFYFEMPEHLALREAYLKNLVVVTPNPHAHALYANKKNLVLLTDAVKLHELGISEEIMQVLLNGIGPTILVEPFMQEMLWQQKDQFFFKPLQGFAAKGVYQGSKLTRKTFADIMSDHYIAQKYIPPARRAVSFNGTSMEFKYDIRNYAYSHDVQWITARLFQGQTMNMRTPGGGFSPIIIVKDEISRQLDFAKMNSIENTI